VVAEQKPNSPETPFRISDEDVRIAAYEGKMGTVRDAIESGSDVNVTDPEKSLTALHMAAYNGHSEIVKLLIDHGATIDCRDAEGKTPLIPNYSRSRFLVDEIAEDGTLFLRWRT
jgi:ankyrin repeat protein